MMVRTIATIWLAIIACSIRLIAQAEEGGLKVGMILPMSGPLADYGIGTKNFIALAVEHNPELGRQVTFVYEDSEYDTAKTVSAYRKLVVSDKVDIVYAFGAPMLQAIAPLAEKDKIPFFSPESDGLLSSRYSFTFLFMNEIHEFAGLLVKELRKRELKRLVIVKNENQFINTWVRGITEALEPDQTVEVFASVEPGTNDFRTIVSRLKEKKFDALGAFLLPGSHRALIAQLSQQGFRPKFFGSDGFQFKPENKDYFDFIDGAMLCELDVPTTLKALYATRFGDSPSIYYSVQGYRFAKLIGKMAKVRSERGISRGETLRKSIHACGTTPSADTDSRGCVVSDDTGNYELKVDSKGVLGTYFSFPMAVYEVKGGEMVRLR